MLYKNEHGIGLIIEIVIVAVIVLVIGVVGYKINQVRPKNSSQTTLSSSNSAVNPKANSQLADQTAGWKTYQSTNEPLSFKYPADWKITVSSPPANSGGDIVDLTSPNGLTLRYYAAADGLGGGCEPPSCPDVQTYRVTPVSNTGAVTDLYLVEGSVKSNYQDNNPNQGKFQPTMGLIGKTDLTDIPKVGTQLQTFPYFFIFPKRNTKTVGHVMFQFQAYLDQNSDLTKWYFTQDGITNFFNRSDVQAARLIFQTVHY